MLDVQGLSLSYGDKALFTDASLRVGSGDRIGLVGSNGTGKSSLFRLIEGSVQPDKGMLNMARGAKVGHLPQDIVEMTGDNPLGTVLSMIPGRNELIKGIARLEADLESSQDAEEQLDAAQRLAMLHEQLECFENTYSEHEAKRILMGLGFVQSDLLRPLHEFSSGWVMRVALASILFQQPDLLLLDEPTNHLDVPSMAWLDGFLHDYKHSMILISHDREFINRQVKRILALEPEGLRSHVGDYDSYRAMRENLEAELEQRARRQQEQIERAERFINRFRAKNTKARAVQSKIKQLEKLERVQVLSQRKSVRFTFPDVQRSGKQVLRLESLSKSFGELVLYNGLNQTVARGERIAIVGRNGAGKTTLMRLLSGDLEPDSGEVHCGHNVGIASYTQRHADALDPNLNVLESVWNLVPSMAQTEVRRILGAFLFSGDEVYKQVGVLSGGERARVALARLLVRPANLMLLDEPTNHLDLESSEMLAEALQDYDGTLVFVSHNRSFVNRLATRVWEIAEGKLTSFPGNLDDYLYHSERQSDIDLKKGSEDSAGIIQTPKSETAYERRKRISLESRKYRDKLRQITNKAEELEKRIHQLEQQQSEMSEMLADPETYRKDDEQTRELVRRFGQNRKKIDELTARWEHQVELTEPLQRKLDELNHEAETGEASQ
ncbi:MAG: ATP-binding cassette domain-containing protein [Candidatus Alcyoniella australis]|nr:ATP-binding cassette domain-containing protein [Candidatus Alcyoniella australis]